MAFVKNANMNILFVKKIWSVFGQNWSNPIFCLEMVHISLFGKSVHVFIEACMKMTLKFLHALLHVTLISYIHFSFHFVDDANMSHFLQNMIKSFFAQKWSNQFLHKNWSNHVLQKRIHIDLTWSRFLSYDGTIEMFKNLACAELCLV